MSKVYLATKADLAAATANGSLGGGGGTSESGTCKVIDILDDMESMTLKYTPSELLQMQMDGYIFCMMGYPIVTLNQSGNDIWLSLLFDDPNHDSSTIMRIKYGEDKNMLDMKQTSVSCNVYRVTDESTFDQIKNAVDSGLVVEYQYGSYAYYASRYDASNIYFVCNYGPDGGMYLKIYNASTGWKQQEKISSSVEEATPIDAGVVTYDADAEYNDGTVGKAIQNAGGGGGGISYSTEEQDTGLTWIDGKKIYQLTKEIGSVSYPLQDAKFSVQTGVDTLVDAHGWVSWYYYDAYYYTQIPTYDSSNIRPNETVQGNFIVNGVGTCIVALKGFKNPSKCFVTIQYTKMTD